MGSTVLIVDDDLNLQRIMTKFLKLEGFSSIPASNGQEALDCLRGDPGSQVGVILLDLRMPVMDGWAFRREQRADPGLARIPVVVLTGIAGEHMRDLDAAAAFNKPVSFPDIVGVVRRLCESA